MKNITHQSTLDFSDLIGIDYKDMDCWGIVRSFYLKLGIELEKIYDSPPEDQNKSMSIIKSKKGDFTKVDTPMPYDIFTAKILGVECHVGIYLGRGKILHTMKNHNCVIDSLDKWKNRITGFYRVI